VSLRKVTFLESVRLTFTANNKNRKNETSSYYSDLLLHLDAQCWRIDIVLEAGHTA
jgi:hypothetical protein